MSRLRTAALALLLLAPTLTAADGPTPPAERSTNDRQIIDTLAKIHDRGAALFNAGDHAGCYRLFQGALVSAKLVLPPTLQDAVDRGLSRAELEPDGVRRALALHGLIEDVRKQLHPTAGKSELLPKPRSIITDNGYKPMPAAPKLAAPPAPVEGPKVGELAKPLGVDAPTLPMNADSPKAPTPPGRLHIDPPPPVIPGVPTSHPKPERPEPEKLPVPLPEKTTNPMPPPDEPLSIPPRPGSPPAAPPAGPMTPTTPSLPMTLPTAPGLMPPTSPGLMPPASTLPVPPLSVPLAPKLPPPPSGPPELAPPIPAPPASKPADDPPPLTIPK